MEYVPLIAVALLFGLLGTLIVVYVNYDKSETAKKIGDKISSLGIE